MLKTLVRFFIIIIPYSFLPSVTAYASAHNSCLLLFECTLEKNDKTIQICGDNKRNIYYRFGKNISQPELKMVRGFGDYQFQSEFYSRDYYSVDREFDFKLQLKNGTYTYNLNFIDGRKKPKAELVVLKGSRELTKLVCRSDSIYPPLEKKGDHDLAKFVSVRTKFREGWIFENNTLHPECFFMEGFSSEGYKDFYSAKTGIKENFFSSTEYQDFSENPGKYFKELDKALGISLKECQNIVSMEFSTNHMDGFVHSSQGDRLSETYYIEKEISRKICMELAPNIEGKCLKSYLLYRSHWGGGSSALSESTIYGMFKSKKKGIFIIPLKRN